MDKPTKEQILNECINYYKPMKVIDFSSIESFTIIMKYKNQAVTLAKVINNKFGQWVYASVHDMWKNPHVSVGYRSKELSKCESCGWLDGRHSEYCKDKKYKVNGYEIRFNTLWNKWIISHSEIGAGLAEFTDFNLAYGYCQNG